VLLAERAAGVARVLGIAEHRTPVDQTGAGDDPVARARLLTHRPGDDLGADHVERARIAQYFEALERVKRRLGVGARAWFERGAHDAGMGGL
jgi:hypothetical protein